MADTSHKLEGNTLSPHVPDGSGRQPFPAWKRIDLIADALSERDQSKVMEAGGPIGIDLYRGEEVPEGGELAGPASDKA